MKLKGQTVKAPEPITIVIPREGEDDIILMAAAVLDDSEFLKICPEPVPPTKVIPGEPDQPFLDDPTFKAKVEEHNQRSVDWMFIKSLSATEGLEWDTVDLNDPGTWANYREELGTVFSKGEVAHIISKVMLANAMDQSRLEEAHKVFMENRDRPQGSKEPSKSPVDQ